MGLTSRQIRPLDRSIPHLRDTRLFVIATEGERTETQYFEIFRTERRNSRVQVRVLPTEEGKSAPQHVLKRLKEYRKKYELEPSDELWLVIDKDNWPDTNLGIVAAQAKAVRFGLAVSRPCFEIWLFLHKADATEEMAAMNSQQIKDALRQVVGGYDHTNLQAAAFEPFIEAAIERAKAMDADDTAARWPTKLGTRVHWVVESILNSAGSGS
jgi:hypothetical protein